MRKLRDNGGSAELALPKDKLWLDGVVADDGSIADRCLDVTKLGERCYCVRIADEDGELPTIAKVEQVRRIASEAALEATTDGGRPR